ncbi:MAG TPA: hypothetical protein VNJ07_01430 [Chitinophagales bacterium]|nr:hypothetical protein [Chitinophagales bacterium]
MKQIFSLAVIMMALMRLGMAQEIWQNHYRSEEVEINFRYVACHDQANDIHKQLVVFRFVNLTDKDLTVSFDKRMWHGDKCTGCERSKENQFTVKLAAHQTVAGSCDDKTKALYIVEKMLEGTSQALTKFELANIRVLTAQ